MRPRRWTAAVIAAAALAGCATVDLADPAGASISGSLFVMWVGEGEPASGDGQFVFVPDPSAPLTFRRRNQGAAGAIVQPQVMYTDGGSIPRVAQAFRGLSPWGYAPAYMIHDWLFVARHCLRDGKDAAQYQSLANVTFEDSAQILYEAIEALVAAGKVKRDDAARDTIAWAVGTSVARRLWDAEGECERRRVPKALEERARADLRANLLGELARAAPTPALRMNRAAPTPRPRSRIVERITF